MALRQDSHAGIFTPFDLAPPAAAQCLDEVYKAFERHDIDWFWCAQCFGPDDKKRMRANPNPRTAPAEAFSGIYNEHPTCSGGEATFLHWLPRAIELQFLAKGIDPSLTVQMFRLGMLAWPDAETQALRRLFCRIALNWWASEDITPLQLTPDRGMRIHDRTIGRRLMEALCAVRVDMESVARALIDIDTSAAWLSLLDAFQADAILGDSVYYVLHDEEDEVVFRSAHAALNRCARVGLSRYISRQGLVEKWGEVALADPVLADAISDAEMLFDAYRVLQNEAEAAHDREAIRMAVQCRGSN